MLNCHHNAHPCLDTRGGGSCEYFKAGSKTVGLMAGGLYSHDIHHSTNLAFVPTLLTNTIQDTGLLLTLRWQKYVAYLCTSFNYL